MSLQDIVIFANPILLGVFAFFGKIWADKKIKKIESKLSKEKFIHELQFNKEFEIYLELWEKLVVLKEATDLILPMLDTVDPAKTKEEIAEERLINVRESYKEVQKIIARRQPFYSKKVYESSAKILSETIKKALLYQYTFKGVPSLKDKTIESYKQAQNHSWKISDIIEEVNQSIRDRILILEDVEKTAIADQ